MSTENRAAVKQRDTRAPSMPRIVCRLVKILQHGKRKAAIPAALLHVRGNPRKSVAKSSSDVQVLHVERVLLDELAPRFDVFAHERGEDGLAFGDIFQLHRKQRAALGI